MAALRLLPRISPIKLRINANGGVTSKASAPSAEMGDPQPGCNITSATNTMGATKDKPSPKRPAFNRLETFSSVLPLNFVLQLESSFTSIGLLMVSTGARLNWTLIVTVWPANSWGTRHECEQTPPQPNSMLPEANCRPSVERTAKVGAGGSSDFPPALSMKLEYCSPPAPKTEAEMSCCSD